MIKNTFLFCVFLLSYFSSISQEIVLPGIYQLETIITNLQEKKIGVVANQASIFRESNKEQHLVDYLIQNKICLLYTSPSPRDLSTSRMPSSA